MNCNFEELISEVEELEYLCDELKYETNDEMKIEAYYLYQYLFSLLISSDKEDAIFRQTSNNYPANSDNPLISKTKVLVKSQLILLIILKINLKSNQ
ncbi:hypothetical protein [Methanothermococcus sp.]|uniref:hypothetical protein n=1 Tax=Methanothermococcus sp. TaxID=2614238 RepID=UPI0025FE1028|nr:hypothetical protein [Methanothermococcus sp.]